GLVGPGPDEREVLAGSARPAPLEAEALHVVRRGGAPGGDLPGADLGAGGVVQLHTRTLGSRGPCERLGGTTGLPRDVDAPVREVVRNFDLDRRELDPAHVADQVG